MGLAASMGAVVATRCGSQPGGSDFATSDTLDDVGRDGVGPASEGLPVLAEAEVLVVGGGPAGLAAAIGASRAGADTLLVERCGYYGGVITQAIMGSITWWRYADTIDAGGVCA
jgi:NADPH-dependent 2,4-dienoyl-CoA reductase/sulfur reductase-like enzyme